MGWLPDQLPLEGSSGLRHDGGVHQVPIQESGPDDKHGFQARLLQGRILTGSHGQCQGQFIRKGAQQLQLRIKRILL